MRILTPPLFVLGASLAAGRHHRQPARAGAGLARWIVVVALLALTPLTRALPAPQAPSLAGLEDAVRDRIAALRAPPDRVLNRRELLGLEAALRFLVEYEGRLAAYAQIDEGQWPSVEKDLQRLAQVAASIQLSGTADERIDLHDDAIRNTMDVFGYDVRQDALVTVPLLLNQDVRKEVELIVARGDRLRFDGLEQWPVHLGKGAQRLAEAVRVLHQAERVASESELEEATTKPLDLVPGEIMDPPSMAEAGQPFELTPTIAPLERDVPELTLAVRAISTRPIANSPRSPAGRQPVGETVPPPQATIGIKTMLDVPAGTTNLPPITVEVPPFSDEVRRVHPGLEAFGNSGHSVDIDGDTAVVGSASFITVLERFAGGVNAWEETATIEDPMTGWRVGSVAISGSTIVVGDPNYGDAGAAFVYERAGDGTWAFMTMLEPPPATMYTVPHDFGAAVDISGDRIVVGDPNGDTGECNPGGGAYLFERNEVEPGGWGLAFDFRDLNFPFCSREGTAVAIDRDLLVLGGTDFVVQVYSLEGGAVVWLDSEEGATIITPDWPRSSGFGQSVAVDAATGTVVVGAPGYDDAAIQDTGAVFVYQRTASGDPAFVQTKRLTALPGAGDRFGTSVAITTQPPGADPLSQMIVVGSPGHDQVTGDPQDQESGSVYLYVRGHVPKTSSGECPPPQDDSWGLLARRASSAPVVGGGFGTAVAASSGHFSEVGDAGEPRYIPASILVGEPGASPESASHVFSGMDPILGGQYALALEVDPHKRVRELSGDGAEENNLMVPTSQVNTITNPFEPCDLDSPCLIRYGFRFEGLDTDDNLFCNASAAQIQAVFDRIRPGAVLAEATVGFDLFQPGSVVTLRWMGEYAFRPVELSLYANHLFLGDVEPCWRLDTAAEAMVGQVVNLCPPCLDCVDLSVDSVQLVPTESSPGESERKGVIFADQNGNQLSRAGVNATVRLDGQFEGPLRSVRLKAWLEFQPGVPTYAKFLDPATGLYTLDEYTMAPAGHATILDEGGMFAGESQVVHLDCEFVGPTVTSAPVCLYPTLGVEVYSGVDENEGDNNTARLAGQNWMVIQLADACDLDTTYAKEMGNDLFNAKVDFGSSLSSASVRNPIPPHGPSYPGSAFGAIGSLDASLDFTVFGNTLERLVGRKPLAFRTMSFRDPLFVDTGLPGVGYSYLDVSLKILGLNYYAVGPFDSFTLARANNADLMQLGISRIAGDQTAFSLTPPSLSFSKSFPGEQDVWCCVSTGAEPEQMSEFDCCRANGRAFGSEPAFCLLPPTPIPQGPCIEADEPPGLGTTIYVGGVPVEVNAAAVATIGLSLGVEVSNNMRFDVTPSVDLGVEVSVEVPAGSPFRAGVIGNLTLIDISRTTSSKLWMEVVRLEQPPRVGICVTSCEQVSWLVSFLAGQITAFATYPWVDWVFKPTIRRWESILIKWDAPLTLMPSTETTPVCQGSSPVDGGLPIDFCTPPAPNPCGQLPLQGALDHQLRLNPAPRKP